MLIRGEAHGDSGCDPVVAVLDMPFSLVADIIFIPHDIRQARESNKYQHSHIQKPQHAGQEPP